MFSEIAKTNNYWFDIIACGGINSTKRASERTLYAECDKIQIFTPLIFEGPRLLRKLRTARIKN
jgi:dihydroorotate dehydrogenase